MVIKNILVIGFKNTGYELCMTINNPTIPDNILKFENANTFSNNPFFVNSLL